MTPDEFRNALRSLKITQRFFAERSGISPSTVNRWATGKLPIPKWVSWLLAALQGVCA
jgi:transcriptional regulator with XRE-family HTH domain